MIRASGDEPSRHGRCHRAADDAAREQVDHRAKGLAEVKGGQGEPVGEAYRLPPLWARIRSVLKVDAFAAGSPPRIVPLTRTLERGPQCCKCCNTSGVGFHSCSSGPQERAGGLGRAPNGVGEARLRASGKGASRRMQYRLPDQLQEHAGCGECGVFAIRVCLPPVAVPYLQ